MTTTTQPQIRQAPHLRAYLTRSAASYLTRQRVIRAIDRYESTPAAFAPTAEAEVLDLLIRLAELACDPANHAARSAPDATWAMHALTSHIGQHPKLAP